MLPPLYTATTGGENSPTPALGPKFVPTNTISVPPPVTIVPLADVTVAGAYVAAAHDGVRCGVVQADADGYAAVPWAAGATFDVRVGAAYAPAQVRRFQPEPAQLVVGMP